MSTLLFSKSCKGTKLPNGCSGKLHLHSPFQLPFVWVTKPSQTICVRRYQCVHYTLIGSLILHCIEASKWPSLSNSLHTDPHSNYFDGGHYFGTKHCTMLLSCQCSHFCFTWSPLVYWRKPFAFASSPSIEMAFLLDGLHSIDLHSSCFHWNFCTLERKIKFSSLQPYLPLYGLFLWRSLVVVMVGYGVSMTPTTRTEPPHT